MEIEQLVGMVRHERAKLASYVALDEILTVVMEAGQRVDQAEKKVVAAEQQLERLKSTMVSIEAEIEQKRVDAVEKLEITTKVATEKFESIMRDRERKRVELEAAIAKHLEFYASIEEDIKAVTSQLRTLATQKQDIESDITVLRKTLRDIKDSIQ